MALRLSGITGALFDLDGTLVDSEPLHMESTNRVLARWGRRLTEREFLAFVGWAEEPFWRELRERFALAPSPAELAELRSAAYLAVVDERPLTPLPGARELLDRLAAKGLPAAVASSSPRAQIEKTLRSAGLAGRFRALVSGHDDVPRGKPHPDCYLAAARAIEAEPARCAAFEDTPTGVAAAKAAGCRTVLVPRPYTPDPAAIPADHRVASLLEIELD